MRGIERGAMILCLLVGVALLGGCTKDKAEPPSAAKSPGSPSKASSSPPSLPGSPETPGPTSSLRRSVPSASSAPQTPDDGATPTQNGNEDASPEERKRKRKAVGWAGVFGSGNHDPELASPWFVALAEKDCGSVVAGQDEPEETKKLVRGIRAVCPVSDPNGQPDWEVAEEVAGSVEPPDETSCDDNEGFDLLRTLVEMHKRDPNVAFYVADDGPGSGSCKAAG